MSNTYEMPPDEWCAITRDPQPHTTHNRPLENFRIVEIGLGLA